MSDLPGAIIGVVLTLTIGSYLLGDNFVYRIATHLLVGVGAAYIAFTAFADIVWPQMIRPILVLSHLVNDQPPSSVDLIIASLALLGCAALVFKGFPRLAGIGNIPIGYLVGVGAAVTLAGVLFGTLGTQLGAAAQVPVATAPDDPTLRIRIILAIVALFGTLTTLLSFGFYRAARGSLLGIANSIGRFYLSAALGATFALVYVASVSLLIDRLQSIVTLFSMLTTGTPKP